MTVNPTLAPLYHAPVPYQPPSAPAGPLPESACEAAGAPARAGFDTASDGCGAFRDPRFRAHVKPRMITSAELLSALITQMGGDVRADHKGRHVDEYV